MDFKTKRIIEFELHSHICGIERLCGQIIAKTVYTCGTEKLLAPRCPHALLVPGLDNCRAWSGEGRARGTHVAHPCLPQARHRCHLTAPPAASSLPFPSCLLLLFIESFPFLSEHFQKGVVFPSVTHLTCTHAHTPHLLCTTHTPHTCTNRHIHAHSTHTMYTM